MNTDQSACLIPFHSACTRLAANIQMTADRDALPETWCLRAAEIALDAKALVASAVERTPSSREQKRGGVGKGGGDGAPAGSRRPDLFEQAASTESARRAVDRAVAHLSEREALFATTDTLAAALAFDPGKASIGAVERAADSLTRQGQLHGLFCAVGHSDANM